MRARAISAHSSLRRCVISLNMVPDCTMASMLCEDFCAAFWAPSPEKPMRGLTDRPNARSFVPPISRRTEGCAGTFRRCVESSRHSHASPGHLLLQPHLSRGTRLRSFQRPTPPARSDPSDCSPQRRCRIARASCRPPSSPLKSARGWLGTRPAPCAVNSTGTLRFRRAIGALASVFQPGPTSIIIRCCHCQERPVGRARANYRAAISCRGPTLPTRAVQPVGGYLGYTGGGR